MRAIDAIVRGDFRWPSFLQSKSSRASNIIAEGFPVLLVSS